MATKRIVYERPVLIKEKKMTFPTQIILSSGSKVICKQCSSCHACRR